MGYSKSLGQSVLTGIGLLMVGAARGEAVSTPVAEGGVLEEIVITAERREASVQDIPIAMSVLTGGALDDKAVRRMEDLQFAAPALTFAPTGLVANVNIRGVGLASGSPSVTNGVATYIDGLFQTPIVTANSFYDIADVQVMRGPQGTFVGASSTGGAIFINSRNPTFDEVSGYEQIELGNYARKGVQAAINLPLSSVLAVRGAVNYTGRDSYYTDHGLYRNEAGKLDELGGRVSVLWKPVDDFQALLKAELNDKDTGGYAYRPIPTTAYAAGLIGGIRDLNYDTANTRNTERANLYSLELRYIFSGITVRSLSGYQDKHVFNFNDSDATTLSPQRTADQRNRERILTEEVNLISPTDGRLSWVLGGYYQKNKIDVMTLAYTGTAFPTLTFIPTEKTISGYFGQISVKALDNLDVQLGVRRSEFTGKQLQGSGLFAQYGAPATPGGVRIADLVGEHSDGATTGKLSINWKVTPDNLLFAFVAKGYKPGGFNSAISQFDPESVVDVELGWKSTFLGGRARTSINGFHYDYQGFQTGVIDLSSGAVNVTNLTDATIQGAEAQVELLLGGVKLDGGVSYVDSRLGNLSFVNTRMLPGANLGPQCATGQTTGCFNYLPFIVTNSGGVNLFSPKLTYNLGVEYGVPLGGDKKLTPRLNYGYVGSQYTNLLYSPVTDRLAGRGLLSALLTYEQAAWNVQLYGSNLTNKEYVLGQNGNNEMYGAPRELGVRFYYGFR